ncbi:MAG TPA: LacI family DNA-binding transcriptional regulator [Spirochaetales bacterium]|nr:LacI family DNA-binding transcriptional regulator [Spirochaetales bacterium]
MKKREVSSRDVANMAGVSRTTVSFVLNATPGKAIPEDTRRRVMDAAASLGYVPDREAAQLAKSTKYLVALAVRHSTSIYSDAYILRLIEGMAPVLNRRRCGFVLVPCGQSCKDIVELVRMTKADGVVITNTLEDDAGVPSLAAAGIPAVVIGTVKADAWQIDIDNEAAAHDTVAHLASLGHRRVAMIVHAPASYHAAAERLAGFRRAMAEADVPEASCPVRWADFTEASGRHAMAEILKLKPRPTAVFAGNDAIAYGAMQAIRDAGLSIPEDISIAGFDDDFPSRFVFPPLTTMTLPASPLGERAAEMIIDLIRGKNPPEKLTLMPTQLSVRSSCAEPSHD